MSTRMLWLASALLAGLGACSSSTGSPGPILPGPTLTPSSTPSARPTVTPTAMPTAQPTPTATPACKAVYGRVKSAYSRGNIGFGDDCGSTVTISVPTITQSGSSSGNGMLTRACSGLVPPDRPKNECGGESGPPAECVRPRSAFWEVTLAMNATLLDGYGDPYITFNDSRFPVTLRSSALIVPGNTYGVCATGPNGAIVQDDFATGKHVTATSDLLRINMLVTPQCL